MRHEAHSPNLRQHDLPVSVRVHFGEDDSVKHFAKGGLLRQAEHIAASGRGGDDLIVHMNREEFELLKQMWGEPTYHPETGMPEYFSLKSLIPVIAAVLMFSGAGSGLGAAMLGSGASSAAAGALGNAIIGGASGALSGGNGSDILRGAALGGLGGYIGGGGNFGGLLGGGSGAASAAGAAGSSALGTGAAGAAGAAGAGDELAEVLIQSQRAAGAGAGLTGAALDAASVAGGVNDSGAQAKPEEAPPPEAAPMGAQGLSPLNAQSTYPQFTPNAQLTQQPLTGNFSNPQASDLAAQFSGGKGGLQGVIDMAKNYAKQHKFISGLMASPFFGAADAEAEAAKRSQLPPGALPPGADPNFLMHLTPYSYVQKPMAPSGTDWYRYGETGVPRGQLLSSTFQPMATGGSVSANDFFSTWSGADPSFAQKNGYIPRPHGGGLMFLNQNQGGYYLTPNTAPIDYNSAGDPINPNQTDAVVKNPDTWSPPTVTQAPVSRPVATRPRDVPVGGSQFSSGYSSPYGKYQLARGNLVHGSGSGRDDTVPAQLSDGEYIMDAETVAMLGDGSTKEGSRRLDEMRARLRAHKGKVLAKGKFSPNAKRPEQYLGEKA